MAINVKVYDVIKGKTNNIYDIEREILYFRDCCIDPYPKLSNLEHEEDFARDKRNKRKIHDNSKDT
jgi:hypothetical protein